VTPHIGRVAAALLIAGVVAGCDSGDDAADATAPSGPAASAAPTAPTPSSPFCAAMDAITARLANDPPDDEAAFIAEAYRDLLPEAPAAIRPELEVLIESLGDATAASESVATTAGVADDEAQSVVTVATNAAERLSDYVDANCLRVGANPGPPPTSPREGFDVVPDTAPGTSLDPTS
jgi:hypothetical protein